MAISHFAYWRSNVCNMMLMICLNFINIELIPNDDDLMKPIQEEEVLVFSQDEFDQLLELQKEIESFDNVDEEAIANGKCKNLLFAIHRIYIAVSCVWHLHS